MRTAHLAPSPTARNNAASSFAERAVELKINGFDGASLGAIQTSFNFRLDAFKNPHLTYRIDLGKGKKPA